MNTLYEKLRKRVYEILYPEGIPVRDGINFKRNSDDICVWEVVRVRYSTKEKKDIALVVNLSALTLKYEIVDLGYIENENDCEILGKPLSLPDLLRAINEKEVYLNNNGRISYNPPTKENLICTLDLSLPISKQTDEVLKKLNALLV